MKSSLIATVGVLTMASLAVSLPIVTPSSQTASPSFIYEEEAPLQRRGCIMSCSLKPTERKFEMNVERPLESKEDQALARQGEHQRVLEKANREQAKRVRNRVKKQLQSPDHPGSRHVRLTEGEVHGNNYRLELMREEREGKRNDQRGGEGSSW